MSLRSFFLICLAIAVGDAADTSELVIDGSSTVYPITATIADHYRRRHPDRSVSVDYSGSSSGFRMLLAHQIPLSGASRPVKDQELAAAQEAGFGVIELPVAIDGITVVVSRRNKFVDHLSVDELKRIWEPGSSVRTWSDVRPGWPDQELVLYAPGKDSGTFEYFTKAICNTKKQARTDVVGSEDDNQLVQGVVADPAAMSYFGWAYYLENQELLRAVPIKQGDGAPVAPSRASILDGSYQPLSRPIFIYVNAERASDPVIADFVDLYLDRAQAVVPEVGYVPLGERVYAQVRARWQQRRTGSVFNAAGQGASISAVLAADAPADGADDAAARVATKRGADDPQFRAAVEDLRDACLTLSRKALDASTSVGEVDRQMQVVQTHLRYLSSASGPDQELGGP